MPSAPKEGPIFSLSIPLLSLSVFSPDLGGSVAGISRHGYSGWERRKHELAVDGTARGGGSVGGGGGWRSSSVWSKTEAKIAREWSSCVAAACVCSVHSC